MMEEENLGEQGDVLASDDALAQSGADEFSTIREHYEANGTLTDDEKDKIADVAVDYLRGILSLFGENHSAIDEYDGDDGELILDVTGGNLAVLIGRHGRTLDALQVVLSSLMSSRIRFYYPIVVDIESYKSRSKRKLQQMALSAASRAKRQGSSVALAPMNAYDRRIIHLTLRNDPEVMTHSEGEEPMRRVVITVVKDPEE
jgi:spoIIIJ-associated protein